MSRVFAYARVSTIEQTTENQLQEIRSAGFNIEARPTVTENVSGSVATNQRAGFSKLQDKLESGDVLVVTKLDRLARTERYGRKGNSGSPSWCRCARSLSGARRRGPDQRSGKDDDAGFERRRGV